MRFVHIGWRYINMDNVTAILDEGDTVTVVFLAAWLGDNDNMARSCERFTGDEAKQLRRWLERIMVTTAHDCAATLVRAAMEEEIL